MRYKTVCVKNVARLSEAGDALIHRGRGMPGMGLIWGETGYGKSTATAWFVNQCSGIHVRALEVWSPSSMLAAISKELGIDPRGSCAQRAESITQELSRHGRPLFVDEADYIIDSKRMTNTLRDLHDMTSVPVVLIGMAGIERSIKSRKQLTGRISQWVEFAPCDEEDARLITDALCEIEIADDLLARLIHDAAGSIRLLVVGLAQLEANGRARGLKRMTEADWKTGRKFFLGEAPASDKVRRLHPAGAR